MARRAPAQSGPIGAGGWRGLGSGGLCSDVPAGPPAAGAAAPPAPVEIEMIGVPTSTVSPSATSSSDTVPACGLGSSTTALAVSISTMIWFTLTASPGCTCQRDDVGLGQALPDIGELELPEL